LALVNCRAGATCKHACRMLRHDSISQAAPTMKVASCIDCGQPPHLKDSKEPPDTQEQGTYTYTAAPIAALQTYTRHWSCKTRSNSTSDAMTTCRTCPAQQAAMLHRTHHRQQDRPCLSAIAVSVLSMSIETNSSTLSCAPSILQACIACTAMQTLPAPAQGNPMPQMLLGQWEMSHSSGQTRPQQCTQQQHARTAHGPLFEAICTPTTNGLQRTHHSLCSLDTKQSRATTCSTPGAAYTTQTALGPSRAPLDHSS
jgi:hypothetical protein